MSNNILGRRIRELRSARRWDQRTLAELVDARVFPGRRGFDVTYLSKIENGRVAPPSVPVLLALAEELGAEADELLALGGRSPLGLAGLLRESAGARAFWQQAAELDLAEGDWLRLAELARTLVEGRR